MCVAAFTIHQNDSAFDVFTLPLLRFLSTPTPLSYPAFRVTLLGSSRCLLDTTVDDVTLSVTVGLPACPSWPPARRPCRMSLTYGRWTLSVDSCPNLITPRQSRSTRRHPEALPGVSESPELRPGTAQQFRDTAILPGPVATRRDMAGDDVFCLGRCSCAVIELAAHCKHLYSTLVLQTTSTVKYNIGRK